MTSQFLQKGQHRFFPDLRLQNKGEEKKENELNCVYQKADLLEKQNHLCFLLFSLLESLMRSNWILIFWGNCDVTSGLDQLDFCKETIAEIILAIKN